MCGRPQCSKHEVEAVRHTITGYFSLLELNLMKNGFQAIQAHAFLSCATNDIEYLRFKVIHTVLVAALDATTEHHFAH